MNQATRRNEIIKSYLQLGSSSNRYAPRLPQQETKSSTKQLAPTDPILGPENLLKTGFAQKGLPSIYIYMCVCVCIYLFTELTEPYECIAKTSAWNLSCASKAHQDHSRVSAAPPTCLTAGMPLSTCGWTLRCHWHGIQGSK